jgi:hypothetical protein
LILCIFTVFNDFGHSGIFMYPFILYSRLIGLEITYCLCF